MADINLEVLGTFGPILPPTSSSDVVNLGYLTSYVSSSNSGFPFSGSAVINGNLLITGSNPILINGFNCVASSGSHAEGYINNCIGTFSHTEGANNFSRGSGSHAEGLSGNATGDFSHAEGYSNLAYGDYSHAEGTATITNGEYSHAEGFATTTYGKYSHAQGQLTNAIGTASFASGYNVNANGYANQTLGIYNVSAVSGFGLATGSVIFGNGNVLTSSNAMVIAQSSSNAADGSAVVRMKSLNMASLVGAVYGDSNEGLLGTITQANNVSYQPVYADSYGTFCIQKPTYYNSVGTSSLSSTTTNAYFNNFSLYASNINANKITGIFDITVNQQSVVINSPGIYYVKVAIISENNASNGNLVATYNGVSSYTFSVGLTNTGNNNQGINNISEMTYFNAGTTVTLALTFSTAHLFYTYFQLVKLF